MYGASISKSVSDNFIHQDFEQPTRRHISIDLLLSVEVGFVSEVRKLETLGASDHAIQWNLT